MDKTENLKQYDEMQHAQLRQILREYQESDVAGIGEEAAFYIMELLSREEKVSTRKAWKTFCREYHPDAEVTHTGRLRGVYRLAVTSVLVSVLLATGIFAAANSFGSGNPPNLSGEQFYFEAPNTPTVSEKDKMMGDAIHQLYEAVQGYENEFPRVPWWLPDGYVFKELDVQRNRARNVYDMLFVNGDKLISINVITYVKDSPYFMERNEGATKVYEINGISFYLFYNYDRMKICWTDGTYLYLLSGVLTEEEAEQIMKSVEGVYCE